MEQQPEAFEPHKARLFSSLLAHLLAMGRNTLVARSSLIYTFASPKRLQIAKHLLHRTSLELHLPALSIPLRPDLQLVPGFPVLLKFALLHAVLCRSRKSPFLITAITTTQRAAIGEFAVIPSVALPVVVATILEKVTDAVEVLLAMVHATLVTSVVQAPQRADVVVQILVAHVFVLFVEVPVDIAGLVVLFVVA